MHSYVPCIVIISKYAYLLIIVFSMKQKLVPYIANRSRWKSFTVTELNFISLGNIRGWMVVLHGKAYLHRLFRWKSFMVPIDPQKPRNFSISNDLQYTVILASIRSYS